MASLRAVRALVLATLFTLMSASLAAPAIAAPARAISISKARGLPLGTVVTVHGTVTTPSGAFESSFFDKGFGLQDARAGIYVSVPTDLNVKPGRLAQVTGTLTDSFGLLILVPANDDDVRLGHAGFQPPPRLVATKAVGESTEGKLVKVFGKITVAPVSDLPYGYKFWIDDGSGQVQVFVNVETGIDLSRLRLGQRVLVTGFSGQFDADYEVLPRSPQDIHVVH